jgi:FKBP-type peptidyl-prolyl cis-trans isomerase FklB
MRYLILATTLLCFSTPTVWATGPVTPTEDKTMQTLERGQQFLEENAKKPGVVRLDSGLEYQILEAGNGTPPGPTDFVTVHYKGTLIDGTVFDSSYARNTPATFAVNAVIPGWTQALQLMSPGAKWMVYIPSSLAYGAHGAGSVIPPHSALIFEIELIAVKANVDDEHPHDDMSGTEEDG